MTKVSENELKLATMSLAELQKDTMSNHTFFGGCLPSVFYIKSVPKTWQLYGSVDMM